MYPIAFSQYDRNLSSEYFAYITDFKTKSRLIVKKYSFGGFGRWICLVSFSKYDRNLNSEYFDDLQTKSRAIITRCHFDDFTRWKCLISFSQCCKNLISEYFSDFKTKSRAIIVRLIIFCLSQFPFLIIIEIWVSSQFKILGYLQN